MNRPKFEVVRNDDLIEVYVNGKCVDGGITESAAETARAVARALGADVVDTDEPSRQPYRYFVVFNVSMPRPGGGFYYMPAVRWLDLPRPIEGQADTDRLCAEFAGALWPVENVRIVNFICVDGPY